jgi:hypothetical protein
VLYITETHAVFESEQTGVVEGGTSLPLLLSVPNLPSPNAENQDGFLQKIAKDAKFPSAKRISESGSGSSQIQDSYTRSVYWPRETCPRETPANRKVPPSPGSGRQRPPHPKKSSCAGINNRRSDVMGGSFGRELAAEASVTPAGVAILNLPVSASSRWRLESVAPTGANQTRMGRKLAPLVDSRLLSL